MSIEQFQDDEAGYRRWVLANPHGYVVNILRGFNPCGARLHRADCWTIDPRRPGVWTGPYVKLCSPDLPSLDAWAIERFGSHITRCATCWSKTPRTGGRVRRTSAPRKRIGAPSEPAASRLHLDPPGGSSTWEIRGPLPRSPIVEAWIDHYIRFERRPVEEEELRNQIRMRLRRLKPKPDEVLHATFLGAKHPAADVENLALYNIDDSGSVFASAARFGLRFELGAGPCASPSGKDYSYGYRYELASRGAGFSQWSSGRQLASWDWIDLGGLSGPKKLEQVWLALARTAVEVASPARSAGTPFTVRVAVRPARRTPAALGGLVKGLFDGVVCAFQAHTNRSNIDELARRIAKTASAQPNEIEALLLHQDKAVLGTVPRLVHLRGKGVIWAPADDLCVAGELLAEPPSSSTWQMKGEILELVSGGSEGAANP